MRKLEIEKSRFAFRVSRRARWGARIANLTLFRASSGIVSRSPAWVSGLVVQFLQRVVAQVVIGSHVPDNPCTALLVVIRWRQTQSRMLAPDTSICVPVPRQFH